MANQYSSVIVFGPTGDVGKATALEASKRGAKVFLAMRGPSKTIEGITKEQEEQGLFTRIQADLSDAESIKKAVQQSGAKAAYIYLVPGTTGVVQALKEAGIEYVVFLSSFSIQPDQDIRQIPPSELISYIHAQIEIELEDACVAHTALRPAFFASNPFKQNLDRSTQPYEAKVTYQEACVDCISPGDIGRVGGAVLVNRPSAAAKEVIYMCGPRLISTDEQWNIIKEVSGKEIKVIHQSPEEYTQTMIAKGMPPPLVEYLVKSMGSINDWYPEALYKEWAGNIKKFSGYEPTTFEDFVTTQKLA